MWLLDELLPEEYRLHRRATRRERLLAWRALLDGAIERLGPGAGQAPGESRRHEFWAHRRAARREEMLACRSLLRACVHKPRGRRQGQALTEQPARIETV